METRNSKDGNVASGSVVVNNKPSYIIEGHGRCFVGQKISKIVQGYGRVAFEVMDGGGLRRLGK